MDRRLKLHGACRTPSSSSHGIPGWLWYAHWANGSWTWRLFKTQGIYNIYNMLHLYHNYITIYRILYKVANPIINHPINQTFGDRNQQNMWLPLPWMLYVQPIPGPAGTSDPSHSNDPSSIEISRWRWSLGWAAAPAENSGNGVGYRPVDGRKMSRLTLNIFTHHPTIIRAISSEGAGDVDHPSQNGESWNNGYVYTEYRASTMDLFNDYIWENMGQWRIIRLWGVRVSDNPKTTSLVWGPGGYVTCRIN